MITAKTPLRTKILLSNAAIVALLLVLGLLSYLSIKSLNDENDEVDRRANIIEYTLVLQSIANNMQKGVRGFLLVGDTGLLDTYHTGKDRFTDQLDEIRNLVGNDAPQSRRLDNMAAAINDWVYKVSEPAIKLREKVADGNTMADLAKVVSASDEKRYFDNFRNQIQLFINAKRTLLANKTSALENINDADELKEAVSSISRVHEIIHAAQLIESAALNMEAGVRGYLLSGDEVLLEPYRAGSAKFAALVSKLEASIADNPSQVAQLAQASETINSWKKRVAGEMIAMRKKIAASKSMDDMIHYAGKEQGKKIFDKFTGLVEDFIEIENTRLSEMKDAAKNIYNTSIIIIVVLALVSLITSVFLATFVSRSITEPFKEIFGGLETFSKNELEDLGHNFSDVVKKLTNHSIDVSSASQTIATSSSGLSSNTNQQASAVEQTSASIEQMNGIVQNNTSLAQESYDLSTKVSENVENLNCSFKKIEESNEEIENLVKVIHEIGEKTRVIDEIVFQTKLLSFNASVEAERAGEHGRGFAVVAQEVGNLAALSGKAAVEISAIVKHSTEKGAVIAKGNSERVEQGASAMRKTAELIDSVAKSSKQIVEASKEQAKGVDQINQAIQEINSATQDSASIAADASRSSGDLSDQASSMNKLVSQLNYYLSGSNSDEPSADSRPGATVVPIRQESPAPAPVSHDSSSSSFVPIKKASGDGFVPRDAAPADSWEDL